MTNNGLEFTDDIRVRNVIMQKNPLHTFPVATGKLPSCYGLAKGKLV